MKGGSGSDENTRGNKVKPKLTRQTRIKVPNKPAEKREIREEKMRGARVQGKERIVPERDTAMLSSINTTKNTKIVLGNLSKSIAESKPDIAADVNTLVRDAIRYISTVNNVFNSRANDLNLSQALNRLLAGNPDILSGRLFFNLNYHFSPANSKSKQVQSGGFSEKEDFSFNSPALNLLFINLVQEHFRTSATASLNPIEKMNFNSILVELASTIHLDPTWQNFWNSPEMIGLANTDISIGDKTMPLRTYLINALIYKLAAVPTFEIENALRAQSPRRVIEDDSAMRLLGDVALIARNFDFSQVAPTLIIDPAAPATSGASAPSQTITRQNTLQRLEDEIEKLYIKRKTASPPVLPRGTTLQNLEKIIEEHAKKTAPLVSQKTVRKLPQIALFEAEAEKQRAAVEREKALRSRSKISTDENIPPKPRNPRKT